MDSIARIFVGVAPRIYLLDQIIRGHFGQAFVERNFYRAVNTVFNFGIYIVHGYMIFKMRIVSGSGARRKSFRAHHITSKVKWMFTLCTVCKYWYMEVLSTTVSYGEEEPNMSADPCKECFIFHMWVWGKGVNEMIGWGTTSQLAFLSSNKISQ